MGRKITIKVSDEDFEKLCQIVMEKGYPSIYALVKAQIQPLLDAEQEQTIEA